MAKNLLHLTAEESTLFEKLPASLREGWGVVEETLTFQDTVERMRARLELMRLHDPKLVAFRTEASKVNSSAELEVLLQRMDLRGVHTVDLVELFFALGPDSVSGMVMFLLKGATEDADIEVIVALTALRHVLLSARQASLQRL